MSNARYLGLTANQLAKMASELEAENAKFRELVKDMRKCLSDECKRCHEWGDVCDLDENLRELGIEVDE